jgi:hypothetical protein
MLLPGMLLPGMILFQDASTHRWIGTLGHDLDLVVTLDDATGCIYSAILVEKEGTMSSFLGLQETIVAHGLFSSFYTDRGSHYFVTPKAGAKVDKAHLTQVGRALSQLGIRHIPSYSPEARGRMERVFGTLQQRLPPELRRAGVASKEDANIYLRETFVPAYNTRFGKPAAEEGSVFVAYAGASLRDVLCVHLDRQVGRDNGVSWAASRGRPPAQRHRQHYVRATVRMHEYPDATLVIFDGPRCLVRCDAIGTAMEPAVPHAA